MESLAGQVEKLKEVGKALVSKKESEIQTLKKEIADKKRNAVKVTTSLCFPWVPRGLTHTRLFFCVSCVSCRVVPCRCGGQEDEAASGVGARSEEL